MKQKKFTGLWYSIFQTKNDTTQNCTRSWLEMDPMIPNILRYNTKFIE